MMGLISFNNGNLLLKMFQFQKINSVLLNIVYDLHLILLFKSYIQIKESCPFVYIEYNTGTIIPTFNLNIKEKSYRGAALHNLFHVSGPNEHHSVLPSSLGGLLRRGEGEAHVQGGPQHQYV